MASDLLTEILRLPAERRARLALELLRSLDGEPDADAAAAWDEKIESRRHGRSTKRTIHKPEQGVA